MVISCGWRLLGAGVSSRACVDPPSSFRSSCDDFDLYTHTSARMFALDISAQYVDSNISFRSEAHTSFIGACISVFSLPSSLDFVICSLVCAISHSAVWAAWACFLIVSNNGYVHVFYLYLYMIRIAFPCCYRRCPVGAVLGKSRTS